MAGGYTRVVVLYGLRCGLEAGGWAIPPRALCHIDISNTFNNPRADVTDTLISHSMLGAAAGMERERNAQC